MSTIADVILYSINYDVYYGDTSSKSFIPYHSNIIAVLFFGLYDIFIINSSTASVYRNGTDYEYETLIIVNQIPFILYFVLKMYSNSKK